MARQKPKKIKPIQSSTFIDDDNQEVLIEVYDELNPPRGRGDNNRFSLKNKVSTITEKVLDDLIYGTLSKNYINKPSEFALKCREWGVMSDDEDITKKSSYRKNAYNKVILELEALFNAIDSEPEKDRNTLGRQFQRAYLKYIKK